MIPIRRPVRSIVAVGFSHGDHISPCGERTCLWIFVRQAHFQEANPCSISPHPTRISTSANIGVWSDNLASTSACEKLAFLTRPAFCSLLARGCFGRLDPF